MKTTTSLASSETFLEHFESELVPLSMVEIKDGKVMVSMALQEMTEIFYNEN